MKYKKLLVVAALCAVPFTAQAAGDYYVGLVGGASFPRDLKDQINPGVIFIGFDSEPDYHVGAFAGKKFGDFRGELEVMYRNNNNDLMSIFGGNTEFTKVALPSFSGMVNGYYDWKNSSKLTPYIGAGAGFIYIKPHNFTTPSFTATAKNESRFGTQLMLGVNAEVSEDISVGLGYRYVMAPAAEEIFAPTHETFASVTFKF